MSLKIEVVPRGTDYDMQVDIEFCHTTGKQRGQLLTKEVHYHGAKKNQSCNQPRCDLCKQLDASSSIVVREKKVLFITSAMSTQPCRPFVSG
jgi:hypothetical protein